MTASGAEQGDSATHIHVYIHSSPTPLPLRLPRKRGVLTTGLPGKSPKRLSPPALCLCNPLCLLLFLLNSVWTSHISREKCEFQLKDIIVKVAKYLLNIGASLVAKTVNNLLANAGDLGSGRCPGKGNGNPL